MKQEALEGLKFVASQATPEHLLFEASWAAGLVSLQEGDAATALGFLATATETKPTHADAWYLNKTKKEIAPWSTSRVCLSCF